MENQDQAGQEQMAQEDQWCFAWLGERLASPGQDRAALLKESQWQSGEIISISFLDGDAEMQRQIREVAQMWTAPGLANLSLDFRPGPPTDIRISFQAEGNWSLIGATCRQRIDQTLPTMNFESLRDSPTPEQIRRYVLHEFGHALGLIHEHQHPSGGIQWNREAVIAELSGPPNNWTLPQIEFNLFQAFDEQATNFTSVVDPLSIMMYPIPQRWTRNGFSTSLNSTLSAMDRQFIHEMYT